MSSIWVVRTVLSLYSTQNQFVYLPHLPIYQLYTLYSLSN